MFDTIRTLPLYQNNFLFLIRSVQLSLFAKYQNINNDNIFFFADAGGEDGEKKEKVEDVENAEAAEKASS